MVTDAEYLSDSAC